MELEKVLHMKGGSGESSYTKLLILLVISKTKATREKAIAELFCNQEEEDFPIKATLCIADLGCASGPNTFTVVSELLVATERIRRKLDSRPVLEYQVFLNDLPGNDFNTVFKSLPKFHQELKDQVGLASDLCFVTAVPGSFYGRLFPRQSLHFAHSSYSLYWLSQLPKGLEDNKRNIFISSTSPPSVVKAYKDQFQKDTVLFLRCRSEELVKGGQMVLTYWGRSSTEDPAHPNSCFIWDFLANILNQLVSEGMIAEEKLEAFNVPVYHASSIEVIEEVQREGSFSINSTDVFLVNCNGQENGGQMPEELCKKADLSKLMRSVVESLLASHFGGAVIDEIFQRFSKITEDAMTKQSLSVTSVTIVVTKT